MFSLDHVKQRIDERETSGVPFRSQYDEEPYIVEALSSIVPSKGCFLDIGAFHPTDKSNTRALVELGWSGVMIEPSPGPMKNLLLEYGNNPKISLICAAVGLQSGMVNLHVTDDAVSTSDEKNFEIWKNATGFWGKMWVPTVSLEALFNQFGGFNFINFDAEGVSADLFTYMLKFTEARPRCVCVEHDGRSIEIMQQAQSKGYWQPYANGTNMVLVYGA